MPLSPRRKVEVGHLKPTPKNEAVKKAVDVATTSLRMRREALFEPGFEGGDVEAVAYAIRQRACRNIPATAEQMRNFMHPTPVEFRAMLYSDATGFVFSALKVFRDNRGVCDADTPIAGPLGTTCDIRRLRSHTFWARKGFKIERCDDRWDIYKTRFYLTERISQDAYDMHAAAQLALDGMEEEVFGEKGGRVVQRLVHKYSGESLAYLKPSHGNSGEALRRAIDSANDFWGPQGVRVHVRSGVAVLGPAEGAMTLVNTAQLLCRLDEIDRRPGQRK